VAEVNRGQHTKWHSDADDPKVGNRWKPVRRSRYRAHEREKTRDVRRDATMTGERIG